MSEREEIRKSSLSNTLMQAIGQSDYEIICQFLHTNHFESDSEWTVMRCNDSFIQGWKEAEKYLHFKSQQNNESIDKEV